MKINLKMIMKLSLKPWKHKFLKLKNISKL